MKTSFLLRVDSETKDALERLALIEKRSMNKQILKIIEDHFLSLKNKGITDASKNDNR